MGHCETGPKRVIGPSRVKLRKRHQSPWWAVGYKVAFAFAAGVFYRPTISLQFAAIATSGSWRLVAANALLLSAAKSSRDCAER